MRYAQIRETDISDGPGIRVGLYTQGCYHHCKGCYNEETWDFTDGKEWTNDTNDIIIELMNKDYIQGLSLLGGDPICTYLQDEINNFIMIDLLHNVKRMYSNKDIWLWTGYTMEKMLYNNQLRSKINPILYSIDVIVDGPYIDEERNLKLPYAGSQNQRVIDVNQSLKMNKVIKEDYIKNEKFFEDMIERDHEEILQVIEGPKKKIVKEAPKKLIIDENGLSLKVRMERMNDINLLKEEEDENNEEYKFKNIESKLKQLKKQYNEDETNEEIKEMIELNNNYYKTNKN